MQTTEAPPAVETCDLLLRTCEGLAAGIELKFTLFFADKNTGEEPEANGFDRRLRLLVNRLELIRGYCERLH